MDKTAIILAGGLSERFGQDKGLVRLAGKPLVRHVFQRVSQIVDEVLVIVSSSRQRESYSQVVPETQVFLDIKDRQSPLVGALTGLTNACGDYSIILPTDTPFVIANVLRLLFELSHGMDAVIPRWPNGYIEPLQAVYRTGSALNAAEKAIQQGEVRLFNMIMLLSKVRYLSTLVVQQIDPELTTFFNINTINDLRKAEKLTGKTLAPNCYF
jgi:molybdopterin-guanine dinucleotide biosynthesis protein A